MLKIPQENLDEDVDDDRVAGSNAVCIGRTGAGGDLSASMTELPQPDPLAGNKITRLF